jgi:hypothetical protein
MSYERWSDARPLADRSDRPDRDSRTAEIAARMPPSGQRRALLSCTGTSTRRGPTPVVPCAIAAASQLGSIPGSGLPLSRPVPARPGLVGGFEAMLADGADTDVGAPSAERVIGPGSGHSRRTWPSLLASRRTWLGARSPRQRTIKTS